MDLSLNHLSQDWGPVQILFSFANFSSTFGDTITYLGSGGAQRQIVVSYKLLGDSLAPGQTLQTLAQLFPTLQDHFSGQYNPYVPQALTLADGTQYAFAYNSYGELTKMTLPTGGVIIYQFPSTMSNSCQSSSNGCVYQSSDILGNLVGLAFRRVIGRNEYSDGSTLSRQTIYTPGYDGSGQTLVTETDEDAAGNPLRGIKHHYLGDAWNPPVGAQAPGYWEALAGKETLTEILDGSQQLLKKESQNWTQRSCGNGENCWWVGLSQPMDHDPQLASVTTTEGGMVKQTSYSYDQNNNITDQYEYDWGTGSPGGLLRHTQTQYVTDSNYIWWHLLNLPLMTTVFDSGNVIRSQTRFGYDEYSGNNGLTVGVRATHLFKGWS